jgi:hypothetical protein
LLHQLLVLGGALELGANLHDALSAVLVMLKLHIHHFFLHRPHLSLVELDLACELYVLLLNLLNSHDALLDRLLGKLALHLAEWVVLASLKRGVGTGAE